MATKSTPNQLRCYRCAKRGDPGKSLTIGDDIVLRRRYRRRDGGSKKIEMVAINCRACGNQWYSNHPEALETARKKDVNLNRRHGIKKAS